MTANSDAVISGAYSSVSTLERHKHNKLVVLNEQFKKAFNGNGSKPKITPTAEKQRSISRIPIPVTEEVEDLKRLN